MKSIAITKPDIGVLSRDRLHLSPFGALAQVFAEELLARAEQEEALWPYVPLELLDEDAESPASPTAPSPITFQVDLHLVLEALRREGTQTEQRQAASGSLERILQIQSQREQRPKQNAPAQSRSQSPAILGTVQQTFQQNLTQNIRVAALFPPVSASPGHHAPGALARQAGLFSRRLQVLREEGKSLSTQSGLAKVGSYAFASQEGTFQPDPRTVSAQGTLPSLPRRP